jgi:hypothetical protein
MEKNTIHHSQSCGIHVRHETNRIRNSTIKLNSKQIRMEKRFRTRNQAGNRLGMSINKKYSLLFLPFMKFEYLQRFY